MAAAIQPDLDLAASLFEALSRATRRGRGIVRDSYGEGEQAAHDIVRSAADTVGLEVSIDPIGNLSMTLPDETAARRASSSVRTSTVCRRAATSTAQPESSPAYPCCRRCTARGRAGLRSVGDGDPRGGVRLVRHRLSGQRRRVRTPRSRLPLDSTIRQWPEPRGDAETARLRSAADPGTAAPSRSVGIRAYLELHIEQGPTLVARGLPAAVVSGIRGCKRFRNARCIGEYAHSGAVARPYRRDAVAATVALLHHMETVWLQQEEAGADLVLT